MTTAATTLDPNTMDPATVVPVHVYLGDERIVEACLPHWHAAAFAAILASRDDTPRLLAAKGFSYSTDQGPGRLLDAASQVARYAEHCRLARWSDLPPWRVPDDAFAARVEIEGSRGYRHGLWSRLTEAHDTLEAREPAAWGRLGRALRDAVIRNTPLILRHPNISPATEADLATRGFTAAEYLIYSAAGIVTALARMYAAATGDSREDFHKAGKDAAALARHAQRTIEEGVRHTLGVPPRAVLMA